MPIPSRGYVLTEAGGELRPYEFNRRDVGEDDILVNLMYCGICHSDLLVAGNELGNANFPLVPGHEIVGRVSEIGINVSNHKVGDIVGIGCIVDSCRNCNSCGSGDEHYCESGWTMSFNAKDKYNQYTCGGYSSNYVVDHRYAVKISPDLDPAKAAPLLCGGITVYAPLIRHQTGPGKRVGILGLGGLGHLAVKFASAMGASVTMLTSSSAKAEDAKVLGADDVIVTSDADAVTAAAGSFDLIINTVSEKHDPNPFLHMLKRDGVMSLVGAPAKPIELFAPALVMGDKSITGSMIAGIEMTQQMLDFCAKHNITAETEVIPIDYVNEAWERMRKKDVRYRFVIDLSTL